MEFWLWMPQLFACTRTRIKTQINRGLSPIIPAGDVHGLYEPFASGRLGLNGGLRFKGVQRRLLGEFLEQIAAKILAGLLRQPDEQVRQQAAEQALGQPEDDRVAGGCLARQAEAIFGFDIRGGEAVQHRCHASD